MSLIKFYERNVPLNYRIQRSLFLNKIRRGFLLQFINIYETTQFNLNQFEKVFIFSTPEQPKPIHLTEDQINYLKGIYTDILSKTFGHIQKLLYGYHDLHPKGVIDRRNKARVEFAEKDEKLKKAYKVAKKQCLDVLNYLQIMIEKINNLLGFTRFRDNYILNLNANSHALIHRVYPSIYHNKKFSFSKAQKDYLFHYIKTYISLRLAIVGIKTSDRVIDMLFIQKFNEQQQKQNRQNLKKMFQNIKIYLLFLSHYSPSEKTNLFEYEDDFFYLEIDEEYKKYDQTLRDMYLPLKGEELEEKNKVHIMDTFVNKYSETVNHLIKQHNTNDRSMYQILKDHDFEYLQLIKWKLILQYKTGIEIFDNIDYPSIFEDVIKRLLLIEIQLHKYRPLDFDYYSKALPDIRHVITASNGVYDEYMQHLSGSKSKRHLTVASPSEFSAAPSEYSIPSPPQGGLDFEVPFDINFFLGEPPSLLEYAPETESVVDLSLFQPIQIEQPLFELTPFETSLPSSSSAPSTYVEQPMLSEVFPDFGLYLDANLLQDPEFIETSVLGYGFYDYEDESFGLPPKRRSLGKKRDEMMLLLEFMFEPPRIYSKEDMKRFDQNDYHFHVIDKKESFSIRYATYNTPKGMLNQIMEREGRSLDLYTSLDPVDDQLVLSLKRGFRISTEYMYKLLIFKEKGQFPHGITDIVLIDARWSYEYESGHIKGSLNINLHYDIGKIFWNDDKTPRYNRSTAIIMFCQYTHKRSVKLYRRLMKADRNFDYPNVYLLEGGYDLFFKHALFSEKRRQMCFEPSFKYQQEEVIGEESEDLSAKEWARLQQSKKSKKPAPKSRLTTRRIPTFDLSGASSSYQ